MGYHNLSLEQSSIMVYVKVDVLNKKDVGSEINKWSYFNEHLNKSGCIKLVLWVCVGSKW